jgi:Transmembrane protein 138
MIKLSLKRFSLLLSFQLFFIFSDLIFNSVGGFIKEKKSITFLYFLQDAFLILSLASLVYSCCSTYVYQAGFTENINRQFRLPILITLIYITLSTTLHISSVYYEEHPTGIKHKVIAIVFVIQKLCEMIKDSKCNDNRLSNFSGCPLNFYAFKRSILMISDPRYYENVEWMHQQSKIH